jgi:nitrite reductase/ring-hydroxylating ferredoxin subunit
MNNIFSFKYFFSLFRKGTKKLGYKQLAMPMIMYLYFNTKNKLYCQKETKKIQLKNLENLNDGEMKQYIVGRDEKESIVVFKYNGNYYAFANHCPHFGAPLSSGLLVDNIIKCPWHGASFDILTGLCDIGPSLDSLNKYEITRENDNYYVAVDMSTLQKGKPSPMVKRDLANDKHFVIIGGGPAGLSCAETLRSAGFTVNIV